MFESVFDITPGFLKEQGVRAVVLDIDNTLVTYGQRLPTKEVKAWVDSLLSGGINAVIASNNNEERAREFSLPLGITYMSKCGKPSRRAVKSTCLKYGIKPGECAVIGDQIFTDVLCAKRAKARAYLVKPLKYKENLFFKFKRALEKPIIASFIRKEAKKK